jgi:hypothetical protein
VDELSSADFEPEPMFCEACQAPDEMEMIKVEVPA